MARRRWLLVAALAVWLVSCSRMPELPFKLPPKGLVFTVGMLGPPQTVLSTVGQTPQEAEVSANLYRPLWDYDPTWQAVPVLAADPPASGVTEEGRILTAKLRGTYLWSDGSPVQGGDFTTARLLSENPVGGRAEVDWSRSLEEVKTQQGLVTFKLVGFWPLGGLQIVPFPAQAAVRLKEPNPLAGYGRSPICCGPYTVSEWVGDGRLITLTPNKQYPWDPAARQIPVIRYRFYDDVDRMAKGIKAGDLQLVPRVPNDVFEMVKNNNPWLQPRWVQSDRLQAIVLRLDSPILADAEVRRALFGGLRRAQWVSLLYDSPIAPAHSWMPDRVWYFLNVLDRVEEEQTDPNWTLERAGWRGKPVRKNGKQVLSLELIYDKNDPRAVPIKDHVVNYWKRIGVEVKPVPVDNLAERLEKRDFAHLALTELPLQPWMSPGQVMGKAGLPGDKNSKGLNYSGWVNDEHEAICHAVDRARDQVELKPLMARQQQLFAQEMPIFPLYFVPELHLVAPTLSGYDPRGFGATSWNSESWSYTPPAGPPQPGANSLPIVLESPSESPSASESPEPSPSASASPSASPSP